MARRMRGVADVDKRGRVVPRSHRHACGHDDRCVLEHYAQTTDCKSCRDERFARLALLDAEAAS